MDNEFLNLRKNIYGDSIFGDNDIKDIDALSDSLNNISDWLKTDLEENIYPDILINKLRHIVNRR